jgi:hypothetical protein
VENIVYIHYGSKVFDPSIGFPIKNREHFNKPYGGLWASRKTATFGWREWCEVEEFRDYDKNDCFQFTLKKDSKVATIYCMNDLRQLPTIKSNTSISWGIRIDFEECIKCGYDAIELCWYGDEYKDRRADDMYFGLYGWDCDSIVVLNPSAIIPLNMKGEKT